jgi:hypothetical protein
MPIPGCRNGRTSFDILIAAGRAPLAELAYREHERTAGVEEYVPRVADRERAKFASNHSATAEQRQAEQALYVAVVHAVDGVRFTTAAGSRRELVHRVAEYVQRWGGYVLRPDHARHLRGLLARGEWEAAVELYFALVGKRWDKEWLVTAVVAADDPRNAAAELGEVATPDTLRESRPADTRIAIGHATQRERAG